MGATMKRTYVWFAAAILMGMVGLASAQQSSTSLGDYARTVRKDKKPATAKQFDNDNLPTSDKLSVVGKAPAEGDDNSGQTAQPPSDQAQASGQAEPKATGVPGESSAARQKMYDDWKQKIAGQKDKVDTLAKRPRPDPAGIPASRGCDVRRRGQSSTQLRPVGQGRPELQAAD